jgi:hypothetical protein
MCEKCSPMYDCGSLKKFSMKQLRNSSGSATKK